MGKLAERLRAFSRNRWLVLVAAMWVQSMAGVGYLFGAISPVLKATLGYDQRQVAALAVAKNLGGYVGVVAGTLSAALPPWAMLLMGAAQNLLGYGWLWLIVNGQAPALPISMMCVLIFVGTNSATYFNTASLVTCIQNFPTSRGPMVGILKGFLGLTSAILTQIYAVMHTTDEAKLVLMAAVGPALVAIAMMFVVRPVGGHKQARPSDKKSFMFVYTICLLLASYLAVVKLAHDFLRLSDSVVEVLTVILFVLLVSPIAIPVALTITSKSELSMEEAHLSEPLTAESSISQEEVEEKSKGIDSLPQSERRNRRLQLGENFTMMQALVKADFWLIWISFLLGSGSGLTVMDNLGQMSQAVGFRDVHIFVSLASIWNFLGRVGGGYFSEIIVREYGHPRHVALAIAQILIAAAHLLFAMAWPGTMYIGTFLVGLGYGAHWAIVPAAVAELFGVKHFGAMYNFLSLANPTGSLIFSGLITSTLYDYEAEKQARQHQVTALLSPRLFQSTGFLTGGSLKCEGPVCFFVSSLIMSGLCIVGAGLSLIVVHRTRRVYADLYRPVLT
ncbi:protein NUCLEAR FUSION DEFECTIVE 4-like isoform X2 [Panicum virgatum]|uniref:Nodulin-like domain-containing protein n=1 Tax=Panicum virgatum TaxID=38727 RepID=A0A8T0PXC7_PANVG|nr:protein NUCLEAR FUSION DEFECTIVE 4-like isoform X2 [Panicum virgatum]KAG2565755.1 hypothetical protein PVAP13_7NG139600 [Panicum virgatum]